MDQEPQQTPAEREGPDPEPAQPPAKRRRRVPRLVVRLGALLLAVIVGLIVGTLSVDLGPKLKERAEREGSKYLQRPMRIGSLSARLIPGTFVVRDIVIEGLTPKDRPFLTAKTITVRFPW